MDYFLTEEQQAVVDIARTVAREKIKPVREHFDEIEQFPREIYDEMAKADLTGVYIPEEYGGFGGGVFELVLVFEELCKVDGSIALALAGTALGTLPIILFGNEEQKKQYLHP